MYENINNNLNQTDFILNYHQHKKNYEFYLFIIYIFNSFQF